MCELPGVDLKNLRRLPDRELLRLYDDCNRVITAAAEAVEEAEECLWFAAAEIRWRRTNQGLDLALYPYGPDGGTAPVEEHHSTTSSKCNRRRSARTRAKRRRRRNRR
jgi:hypothetical protein